MVSLNALPKVELHLHLDCSLSFEAVAELRPEVTREIWQRDYVLDQKCTDLADFLSKVPRSLELMQDEQGLRTITAGLFHELKQDGVIYAEIRFAPLQHLEKGLTARQVVEIVDKAVAENIAATGIQARLLLCTLRHFSKEQGLETARLVHEFRDRLVAGLDLAADEAGFPIEAHIDAFKYAQEHDLCRTAHAGEAKGYESVTETLAKLNPSRIGHGVRSIESPQLVEQLAQDDIHLEVCPACNVLIDVYPTLEDHPIDKLYRAGVSLSVNTDGRTLPKATLTEQYQDLAVTFGWGPEHFLQCNLAGLDAAFLDDTRRETLKQQLKAGYPSAS